MLSSSVRRKAKITKSSLRTSAMQVSRFASDGSSNVGKGELMIPRGYVNSWESINSPEIVEHLRWCVCHV